MRRNLSTAFMRLPLALTLVMISTVTRAQEYPINLALARQYVDEAEALCSQDNGRLWGVRLCGPTLFVDAETRALVANQGDRAGSLTRKEGVFVGQWPVEMNISNTAVEWAGTKWTMIAWPLPADMQERAQLMLHEMFHRVQGELGLPGSNPANSHLDTRDGRVWLQLEWRALAHALMSRGVSRQKAVADALTFRAYRHSLFPRATEEEKALVLNEGLAEYTGLKLSSGSGAEFTLRAGCALRQARQRPTFVRSFAYVSGPAYGALLDESGRDWRRGLAAGGDLGALLLRAHSIKLPRASRKTALTRAGAYGGEALMAAEAERESARQELVTKYRARFLEHPVIILPLTDKVQYSFNPNNLIPLDESGTVYPTLRVSDEWGVLEVAGGALVVREGPRAARVVIAAPNDLHERPLKGPGWTLQLSEGWEFGPAEGKGSFQLERKAVSATGGVKAPQVLSLAQQIAVEAGAEIWPGFDLRRYSLLETESGASQIRFTTGRDDPDGQVFMTVGDDYFQRNSLEEGLEITFHEAFHGFERDRKRAGARWRAENSLLVAEYPETSARNNALFRIEGLILFSALESADETTLKSKAREFIAVRGLRQGELEPRFVEFEKGAESNEGLAEYAGARAVVAGLGAARRGRISAPFQNLDERAYLLRKFDRLKAVTRAGRNSRLRFYYTGAAQGFMLDTLLPGWKSRVQASGAAPQDLIEEAAEYTNAARQLSAEDILKEYGYEAVLKEEEAEAAKKEAERQALLDSVLNQEGRRYVIDLSALGKMGDMRSFDPMNVTVVDKQKRVHTRILKVGDDGLYEAEFSQPVVEDFETRQYITVSRTDQKPEIFADGAPLDPTKSAEKRFEKKLTIKAAGFNLEAHTGVVAINERGILVRVALPQKP